MIVVNLFGGPGVGKSTLAATLFAHYKRRGLKVEMAREQAKELLYQGRDLPRNQVLIVALQYQALKNLEAAGTELVISDSALRLNLIYSRHLSFYQPLAALVRGMCQEFTELDVRLRRSVPYHAHGRLPGTVEEASKIDDALTGKFDVDIAHPDPRKVIKVLDPIVLKMCRGAR